MSGPDRGSHRTLRRWLRRALGAAAVAGGAALASAAAAPSGTEPARPDIEVGRLALPVEGVAAAGLRDTFVAGRPGHLHEAIDIAAPRGTRVYAVDDGTVVKLFRSVPGGLTVYQFDP